jgi:hypothetical protein
MHIEDDTCRTQEDIDGKHDVMTRTERDGA